MEDFIALFFKMAPYVHFLSFGLLLLAGFNLPISEDLVFIVSASIAATIVPENTVYIFLGCFLGAYISDVIAYLIGHYCLGWLMRHPRLSRFIPAHRIHKLEHHFVNHGIITLFFGRFIPFGVRNALFMTCGVVKMPVYQFLITDLLSCSITSVILFTLGYKFGKNYKEVLALLNDNKIFILIGAVTLLVSFILIKKFIQKRKDAREENKESAS